MGRSDARYTCRKTAIQLHQRTSLSGGCNSQPLPSIRAAEKGSVTPMLIGLMAVMMTTALGMFSLTESQSRYVVDNGKHMAALSLAEAGIDHVIWRLRQPADDQGHYGNGWRNLADEQDVPLGNGVYHVASMEETATAGIKGLRVEGWIPSRTAPDATKAELYAELATIYETMFSAALFGDKSVEIVGNPSTDSYNSNNGFYSSGPKFQNGDIGTNNAVSGAISLTGHVGIQGRALIPHGGSPSILSTRGNCSLTGGVTPMTQDMTFKPIPEIPVDAVHVKPVTASGSGPVHLETLTGETILSPIPPGTYVIHSDASGHSVTMSGGSSLEFNGTDRTVVYLEGNAKISGNGIVNSDNRPTHLLVYGMAGCNQITHSGNTDFYGAIYAPQAEVRLNGNDDIFGAIAASAIRVNGNVRVHYDEALREMEGAVSGYRLHSWTQIK